MGKCTPAELLGETRELVLAATPLCLSVCHRHSHWSESGVGSPLPASLAGFTASLASITTGFL